MDDRSGIENRNEKKKWFKASKDIKWIMWTSIDLGFKWGYYWNQIYLPGIREVY